MKDTIVAILGVVLVVGSMAAVIETSDAGGEDGEVVGPPPILGQASWTTEGCTYLTLGWQVPPERVEEVVSPWKPRVRGGTTFVGLYAYECPTSIVSGISQPGEAAGGGVMVFIQAPPANLTANSTADRFSASPELFVGQAGGLADALTRHGFTVTQADVSIAVTDLVVGQQVTAMWSTSGGQIGARGLFPGDGAAGDTTLGLVAVDDALFGLQDGPLTGNVFSSDTVTVTSSGETWVSRLGLGNQPDEAGLLQEAGWELDILSRELPNELTGQAGT